MAVKVAKAWLTERRATQTEARQEFDALIKRPQLDLPDSNERGLLQYLKRRLYGSSENYDKQFGRLQP
jgi:hypothetical protein